MVENHQKCLSHILVSIFAGKAKFTFKQRIDRFAVKWDFLRDFQPLCSGCLFCMVTYSPLFQKHTTKTEICTTTMHAKGEIRSREVHSKVLG